MSMEGLKFQTLSAEGIFAQKAGACAHSVVNISACVTSHLLEKGAVRSSLNEFVHFHSRMAYNRIKQIFEALEARDAVLLNEILESMNGRKELPCYFGGREATTRTASAVRRLQIDGCLENYDL